MNNKNVLIVGSVVVVILLVIAIQPETVNEGADQPIDTVPVAETDNGAMLEIAGTYGSGFLDAASTPGREYTLVLNEDGTAEMTSDFKTEDRPVVDTGAWEVAESRLSTTFTHRFGFPMDENVLYSFEVGDGVLTLLDFDMSRWGTMGLTLSKEE